jgi:hypothetical protein
LIVLLTLRASAIAELVVACGGNTIPILPHCVTPSDFSLARKQLGPEGGIAMAGALTIKRQITTIR